MSIPEDMREVIRHHMKERGLQQRDLTRINPDITESILSFALNGSRSFTLNQVDEITKALGVPVGSLYMYYPPECLNERGNRMKGKSATFVARCYELGLEWYAESTVAKMIEEGASNHPAFYAIADRLQRLGLEQKALTFYSLLEQIKPAPSLDLLAVCLYKQFSIYRYKDLDTAYDYAMKLSNYLSYLPDREPISILEKKKREEEQGIVEEEPPLHLFRFTVYREVIATLHVMGKWDKMLSFCEELLSLTQERDRLMYGLGLVYKEYYCRHHKDFPAALALIDEYSQIDGGSHYDFQKWAEGNRFSVYLEMGDLTILPSFLDWIERYPEEKQAVFPLMLESLDKHGKYEDLQTFMVDHLDEMKSLYAVCLNPLQKRYTMRYLFVKAKYHIYCEEKAVAIRNLIQVARLAIECNMQFYFFESIREVFLLKNDMTTEQEMMYIEIIELAKQNL